MSSRFLECEVWNRINAHQLQNSDGEAVRNLIGRVAMIEMVGPVLTRALQPFPIPVRTLDAIHLAALEFIRAQKQSVQLASYDKDCSRRRGFSGSQSGARKLDRATEISPSCGTTWAQ